MSSDFRFRRAIGLEYDERRPGAPTVAVKGDSRRADEIVKIARRYGVPVVTDRELARALSAVELDEEIPEPLFRAVAVLLDEIERIAKPRLGRQSDKVPNIQKPAIR